MISKVFSSLGDFVILLSESWSLYTGIWILSFKHMSVSVWGSEGHHWACLMLLGPPGLLLPARGYWWCCSCQAPVLQPLTALSSHHGQTACTVRQAHCLLALPVWHFQHLNSVLTQLLGSLWYAPASTRRKTAWPPSLLSKTFQDFCWEKTGINYCQLSPPEQTEQTALILQLWVTPLDGGEGKTGLVM